MVVDIPDLVTYTNFSDHRLRGFWVAGGQISPSSIDFHRRPYNTLALPCERVIFTGHYHHHCVCVTGHDHQASGVTAAHCAESGESAQLVPGNQ